MIRVLLTYIQLLYCCSRYLEICETFFVCFLNLDNENKPIWKTILWEGIIITISSYHSKIFGNVLVLPTLKYIVWTLLLCFYKCQQRQLFVYRRDKSNQAETRQELFHLSTDDDINNTKFGENSAKKRNNIKIAK